MEEKSPIKLGWNKESFHHLLERGDLYQALSKTIDYFLISCILINVTCIVLETVPEFNRAFQKQFDYIEMFTVVVFSIEYLLRVWCCVVDPEYKHPVLGRLNYMRSPLAVVDLLAIVPFYIPFFFSLDITILAILRIFRLIRIVKLFRYSQAMIIFIDVYRLKKNELKMIVLGILLVVIFSSAIVYYFEHEAQPDKFSSIPASMWWALVTLTTVGYGDVYPITVPGKIFASIIALMGIGMVALPSAILGSGFVTVMRRKSGGTFKCPHCKKEIERGKHPIG